MTNSRGVNNVVLSVHGGKHHGLAVENGVYISRITPGSVAAREGSIAVGDRLLSVSFVISFSCSLKVFILFSICAEVLRKGQYYFLCRQMKMVILISLQLAIKQIAYCVNIIHGKHNVRTAH